MSEERVIDWSHLSEAGAKALREFLDWLHSDAYREWGEMVTNAPPTEGEMMAGA